MKYPALFVREDLNSLEVLQAKNMTIAATGISYRTINNWEQHGLIDNSRDDNKRWRKFSLIDCVWIKIISDLRCFGFPIEKIKNIKESLYSRELGGKMQLEKIVLSFTTTEYLLLLIFMDGKISTLPSESKKKISRFDSHLCLNLINYFDYFIENEFRETYHKELKDYYF